MRQLFWALVQAGQQASGQKQATLIRSGHGPGTIEFPGFSCIRFTGAAALQEPDCPGYFAASSRQRHPSSAW